MAKWSRKSAEIVAQKKKHNERKGQQKTKIQVKYWSSLLKIQIFMSEYDGGPNVYIYI